MPPPKPRLIAAALLLLASATASAAPGRYGFGVEAETSGLLSPVLQSVTISRVLPGSPAAARPMAARLHEVSAGQHLRLGVLRAGRRLIIELVAAAP